jgi:hypothetical protein
VNRSKVELTDLLHDRSLEKVRSGWNLPTKTLPWSGLKIWANTKPGFQKIYCSKMKTRQTIESTQGSTAAHFTCQWDIEICKHARTASNIPGHEDSGFSGWTKFSMDFSYLGPLPIACPHGGHPAVIGRNPVGKFQSHFYAAYTPSMNKYLAHLFFNAMVNRHTNILKESGDGISS